MPINKETIISVFDDKLTLMQWLKTINKALEDAVLTGVEITKKGNATLSFKFTFEDGTYLETNDLVLQQGESVVNAFIQNGHLYLTLSNGTNLDAGNVKPVSNFSIDASQHLIVNYADGTSQDLGAIFSGNVNIDGNFTANSIIEKPLNYGVSIGSDITWTPTYVGIVKTGYKITFVIFGTAVRRAMGTADLATITLPSSVADKLIPYTIGTETRLLATSRVSFQPIDNIASDETELKMALIKYSSNIVVPRIYKFSTLAEGTYVFRYEQTFLLSDNLAQ